MRQERHHWQWQRARLALLLCMLAASGCAKSEPVGSSSSTNFVVCEDDGDCAGHAGAVGCDEQGYCVDADGDRITASDGPDDAATTEPICDGSPDMRLGITQSGGFVASTYTFTNPHGSRFLFVDGQCRYYASVDYMQGIATGTLSSAQAEQLAADIGWAMLPAWSAYSDVQCPDAGASIIMQPSYAATCICGCQDMGPPGLATAMNKALEWLQNLNAQGTPSTGAVRALADPMDAVSGSELAWPLDRSIADIPGLVQDFNPFSDGLGARFADPVEASALRDLRSAAVDQVMSAQTIPVLDDGQPYVVFARDELPDGVDAAINTLEASTTPTF